MQVRLERRLVTRAEQKPSTVWKAFQEQRKHEDAATLKCLARLERETKVERGWTGDLAVALGRLRRGLDRFVRKKGGTDYGVLIGCLKAQDPLGTGSISLEVFRSSLRFKLGIRLQEEQLLILYKTYSNELFDYAAFAKDVGKFCERCQHFSRHPDPTEVQEILGSTPRSARSFSPLVRRFIKKLRKKLDIITSKNGEYERILIRRAFLNWDADASGRLSAKELLGAMRQLKMRLTQEEATEIVKAFDTCGSGEFTYQPLVEVVCEEVPHFFTQTETISSELASNLRGSGALTGGPAYVETSDLQFKRKKLIKQHKRLTSTSAPTPEEDLEDEKLLSQLFTARPKDQHPSKTVELFKRNLRHLLETFVLKQGGTVESHLREAFLKWDASSSGELTVSEFQDAMTKSLGFSLNSETATQIVRYYDHNGKIGNYDDEEIHYKDLIEDICQNVPHFSEHPDTARLLRERKQLQGSSFHAGVVKTPRDIRLLLDQIKDAPIFKKKYLTNDKDFFLGICARLDADDKKHRLSKDEFIKVLRELDFYLKDHALEDILCW